MSEKTRLEDENRFTNGAYFARKTKRKNEFSVDDKTANEYFVLRPEIPRNYALGRKQRERCSFFGTLTRVAKRSNVNSRGRPQCMFAWQTDGRLCGADDNPGKRARNCFENRVTPPPVCDRDFTRVVYPAPYPVSSGKISTLSKGLSVRREPVRVDVYVKHNRPKPPPREFRIKGLLSPLCNVIQ